MAATDDTQLDQLFILLDRTENVLRDATVQQGHCPAHEAFYRWGSALDQVTATLQQSCQRLDQQLASYGNDRILRDDEGIDPAERIRQMRQLIATLADQLRTANITAQQYHNAASHLAVAVDPDARVQG